MPRLECSRSVFTNGDTAEVVANHTLQSITAPHHALSHCIRTADRLRSFFSDFAF
jgi:hypothetical protein